MLVESLEVGTESLLVDIIHRVYKLHVQLVRQVRQIFLPLQGQEVIYVLGVERLNPFREQQSLVQQLHTSVFLLVGGLQP